MKKIYGFLVMIFCIISTTNPLHAQWVQTTTPPPGQIQCIAISGADLFEGNAQGQVFYSTNNGSTWTAVTNNLVSHVINVSCLAYDGTHLIAVDADGAGVYISTNKGTSWTAINNGLTDPWINTVIISGTKLYAGSTYGEVFVSSNYGANWSMIGSAFCNSRVLSIAAGASNIFASTQANGLFRSIIGDTVWTPINSGLPVSTLVTNLAVKGNNLFAAVYGSGGGVFLSTNNGDTWTLPGSAMTSDGAYGLTIYPAGNGTSATNIFAGTMDNHGILLSSDTAATWQSVGLAIAFDGVIDLKADNGKLFALTVGEEIWYRSLSEMINSVNEISGTKDGLLIRNYPNPFQSTTTIKYYVKEQGFVSLKIFDIMGTEVATLVNEQKPVGDYSIEWNAAGLANDIYFCKLVNGRSNVVKKMLLMK
jgi:photosystem II stability/assembly factor-like uncharacterized protein